MISPLPVAPPKTPVPEATVNVPHTSVPQAAPLTESRRVLLASRARVTVRLPATPTQPSGPASPGPSVSCVLTAPNPSSVPVPQSLPASQVGASLKLASKGWTLRLTAGDAVEPHPVRAASAHGIATSTPERRPVRILPPSLLADGVARAIADGDPDSVGCCCDAAGVSCAVSERRKGADDSARARVDLRDGVSGPADPAGRPDGTGSDRDGTGLLGGEVEPVDDSQRSRVDFVERSPRLSGEDPHGALADGDPGRAPVGVFLEEDLPGLAVTGPDRLEPAVSAVGVGADPRGAV